MADVNDVTVAKRTAVCIINPRSSHGRTVSRWRREAPVLRGLLADYQVVEVWTRGPGDAVTQTQDAIAGGAAVVVAVGGDGTVHEVVQGFVVAAERGGPEGRIPSCRLAVLPHGTGNDFARGMAWERSPQQCAARILQPCGRRMDVGTLSLQPLPQQGAPPGAAAPVVRHFANIASVGASAVSARLAKHLKWARFFTYILSTAAALVRWQRVPIQLRLDGAGEWRTLEGVTMVAIGNGSYFGRGMRIAPGADPCDGRLRVVVVCDRGALAFALESRKLRAGRFDGEPGIVQLSCGRVELRALRPADNAHLLVEADGDVVGSAPLVAEILPGLIAL